VHVIPAAAAAAAAAAAKAVAAAAAAAVAAAAAAATVKKRPPQLHWRGRAMVTDVLSRAKTSSTTGALPVAPQAALR
jgi:hypothetical protein